jgi:tetratricopeptide (TPR) repeat protein
VVDRQIPTSFDGENRQIISLTREMAFGKGAEALRERDVRSMLNAYLRFQVEDQPSSFYYSLGKMYIRLGKFNEALDAMRAANTREPNNPLIRYDVGVLYAKLGNQRQAIKELSWVVKQFSLPSEDPYKASALSLLGAAYFEQSNFDQAYRAWNKSLAIEPNNLDTRINLAMIQVRQNRLEEAIASFEKILVMSGASPKVLNNLATTYYRAENYQKSIEYLQRALKVAPKQTKRGNLTNYDGMQPSQLFTYLGQAYFKLGHTGAAISSYESACKLNPTVSCQQQLGELYFQARRFTEAAQTLLGVLEAGADNVNLYGVLGSALAEVKDYDRAVEIFTEGLRNAKDRNAKSDLHRNIGNLYIRMKKYDLARKEFQLAVTHNFKSQEARFGLAYALASQNRFKQAHDELKRILQRDPSFARARDLLSDVEKRL